MPRLHHFTLDPYSRRIRLALNEYGTAVELRDEQPWAPSPELYKLNPAATLPVFVEDDGSAINGVEALGEYLEETRNGAIALIQGDAKGRAEVRRLVGWFDTKFYAEVAEPVLTEKVIRRFMPREHGGGSPEMPRVRKGLDLLKAHLDYIGRLADGRNWLAGDNLSLADLAAAAHLSAIDYIGDVPWADFPSAKAWFQRLKSRPSFRPLLADVVRGIPPSQSYTDLDF
ncbi:glutathione S-transferase family protein [Taklimakanibacter deserti]|uniref:glutathione S-transferase family protein n=1 Tax=Taklimakanibacter deserti TaxID=2267839 RepID=UPI000E64658A